MKQQHTPGPWYGQNQDGPHNQGLIASEATSESVAVCYDARDTALIAAAPDMLETLEAIHELLTDPKFEEYPSRDLERDIARWADEAIRKATETGQ